MTTKLNNIIIPAKRIRIAIQGETAYLTAEETVKEFTFDEIIDLEDDEAFDENDEDEDEDIYNATFSTVTLAEQIVDSLLDGTLLQGIIKLLLNHLSRLIIQFVGSHNCVLAYGLVRISLKYILTWIILLCILI